MYENSRKIGNMGEAVALAEFIKHGIEVYCPFGQNTPVDMLIYAKGDFLKIQVKTTKIVKNNCMKFELCRTNGFTGKSTPYKKEEVDYVFLYCIENDYRGIVPFEEIANKRQLCLRIGKTKNNQTKGVNKADTFLFERWITEM